jgi:hypothetical protein
VTNDEKNKKTHEEELVEQITEIRNIYETQIAEMKEEFER